MATCLECHAELPSHAPGCDTPEVARLRSQPAPTGGGPEVLPVVLRFLADRQEHGRKKYGTTLRAHNGRSAIRDAREEAADQLMYLTQLEMEWPALVGQVRLSALGEVLALVQLAAGAEAGKTAEGALERLAGAILGLMGLPPVKLQGPRMRRPKQHRWAAIGGPVAGSRCRDCALERRVDSGLMGGAHYVYALGGLEIARHLVAEGGVPSCPPTTGEG